MNFECVFNYQKPTRSCQVALSALGHVTRSGMGQLKYQISDLADKALIRRWMIRWFKKYTTVNTFKKCLAASELKSLMTMNMEQRH